GVVFKVNEGRANVADEVVNRKIDLIINTPLGRESFFDDRTVRRAAMMHEVPCITTLTGAAAAVSAIRALREQGLGVRALQDYYAGIAAEKFCPIAESAYSERRATTLTTARKARKYSDQKSLRPLCALSFLSLRSW